MEDSTPARSSRKSRESPSQPGKVKCALPGNRPAPGAPRSTASGTAARTPSIRRSRSAAILPASSGSFAATARRPRKCGDRGCVQGPGADVAFLPAAVLDRGQFDRPAQEEGTDPDRSADLVAGDGHRVKARAAEVHRHGAERLDGVGVHGHAGSMGQLHDPGDGLDGADLVVGPHDGDERDRRRVPGELGLEHREVHDARGIHREPADLGTFMPLEPFDGVQHSMVFDGGAAGCACAQGPRRGGPSTVP